MWSVGVGVGVGELVNYMEPLEIRLGNQLFSVDLKTPMDISIPLRSGNNNPNCYHVDQPSFTPIVADGFIGSVSEGGPCNHQSVYISPHGNGTHTECYGHISPDPDATINRSLKRFHFIANLVSVQTTETSGGDRIIKWSDLASKFSSNAEALVIRTLPNGKGKLVAQYSGTNPPYLEREVAQNLAQKGISHLLVDLPSVDKENDGGELLVHRDFWNYPEKPRKHSTITELIYVPDILEDGLYLLNLQIASLESDASPSKPVLYPLISRSFK